MKWEYKMVIYLLLTYFIAGLMNYFTLKAFVVPLPLSFIFASLVTLTFIIKTKPSIHTILYLGIPLIMLKDLIIYYNENLGIAFIVISLISWMVLGVFVLKEKRNLIEKITGIGLLAAPLLLIGNQYVTLTYLLTLLFVCYRCLQADSFKLKQPLERSVLLFVFISTLFLLNEASIYLVS